jgi:hypothetical protein
VGFEQYCLRIEDQRLSCAVKFWLRILGKPWFIAVFRRGNNLTRNFPETKPKVFYFLAFLKLVSAVEKRFNPSPVVDKFSNLQLHVDTRNFSNYSPLLVAFPFNVTT